MTSLANAPDRASAEAAPFGPKGTVDSGHQRLVVLAVGTVVFSASTLPGLGLAIAVVGACVGTALVLRPQPNTARWCLLAAAMAPWLLIRDNRWLALCIVGTVVLVVALALISGATGRSIDDVSFRSLLRLRMAGTNLAGVSVTAVAAPTRSTGSSVLIGSAIALPVVGLFYGLLASADVVFASWVDPSILPIVRIVALVGFVPIGLALARFGSNGASETADPRKGRLGVLESTIVLSAVSVLFGAFIAARLSTIAQPLENLALRGEVREGFFQLLWVAALTVVLVLALRGASGTTALNPRVRRLGRLTIALAAVIDGLALLRISQYIDQTFHTPLRFWSFSFGIWLLFVLALTAIRLGRFRAETQWFTAALVTSWIVYVFVLGMVNPDQRIARHNFDHTGQVEWIAVNNLITLSEDATPVIVESIDVLRPMPNTRFDRMVAHLCAAESDSYPRDLNLSRRTAASATAEICARD